MAPRLLAARRVAHLLREGRLTGRGAGVGRLARRVEQFVHLPEQPPLQLLLVRRLQLRLALCGAVVPQRRLQLRLALRGALQLPRRLAPRLALRVQLRRELRLKARLQLVHGRQQMRLCTGGVGVRRR